MSIEKNIQNSCFRLFLFLCARTSFIEIKDFFITIFFSVFSFLLPWKLLSICKSLSRKNDLNPKYSIHFVTYFEWKYQASPFVHFITLDFFHEHNVPLVFMSIIVLFHRILKSTRRLHPFITIIFYKRVPGTSIPFFSFPTHEHWKWKFLTIKKILIKSFPWPKKNGQDYLEGQIKIIYIGIALNRNSKNKQGI